MAICIAHSTMIGSVDLGLGASTNEILSKLTSGMKVFLWDFFKCMKSKFSNAKIRVAPEKNYKKCWVPN